jgi:hypothetical protein
MNPDQFQQRRDYYVWSSLNSLILDPVGLWGRGQSDHGGVWGWGDGESAARGEGTGGRGRGRLGGEETGGGGWGVKSVDKAVGHKIIKRKNSK